MYYYGAECKELLPIWIPRTLVTMSQQNIIDELLVPARPLGV